MEIETVCGIQWVLRSIETPWQLAVEEVMDLGCELLVSFVDGRPLANEELDALAKQGARWIKMAIGNVVLLSLTNLHPRSRDCVVCFGPIVFSLGVLWF